MILRAQNGLINIHALRDDEFIYYIVWIDFSVFVSLSLYHAVAVAFGSTNRLFVPAFSSRSCFPLTFPIVLLHTLFKVFIVMALGLFEVDEDSSYNIRFHPPLYP